jgi:AcrR family transcriptional regulator
MDPRRRLPPHERRAIVLEAAAKLFAERGYAGTRLDDVAAAAHVTKPVLYRHFASKKALYLALLEEHRAQLGRFVAGGEDQSLDARLRAILETWFAYVEARPHAWKMIFRDSGGDAEVQAVRTGVQESARAVLVAFLKAQPEIDAPPEQIEPLAELLRTGMAGLALWWIDHPDVEREVVVDATARLVGGLLRP